jgi:hypothetical protein
MRQSVLGCPRIGRETACRRRVRRGPADPAVRSALHMNVEDYCPQGKRWWVIPHARRPPLRVLGFDPEREIDQISLELMFDDDAEKRSTAPLRRELPPLIFETRVHADGPSTMANLFTAIANETPATTELDLEGAGWAPGGVGDRDRGQASRVAAERLREP